jgi:hypothetical protein
MDTTEVNTLLAQLLTTYGQGPAEREEISVWVAATLTAVAMDRPSATPNWNEV